MSGETAANSAPTMLRIRNFWYRTKRYLLGDDIFVSYARSDGVTYAAGLASRLAQLNYSCRVDLWGTKPGEKTPPVVIRALQASSMLVVLGTSGSMKSAGMQEEIEAFKQTGRNIIPIQVDGTIQNADWWRLLQGLPITREESEPDNCDSNRKHTGNPSDRVIERISKTFVYQTRQQRLRHTAWVTASIVGILIVAAAGLTFYAEHQAGRADEAQNRSERANHMADAQTAMSNSDLATAVIAAQQALSVFDGPDAQLLLSNAYNQGLPSVVGRLDAIKDIAVSPANADVIAAIGISIRNGENQSQLSLWHAQTGESFHRNELFFAGLGFNKAGDRLYAIALTGFEDNDQKGFDRTVVRNWSIIEYDLQLKEQRRVAIPVMLASPSHTLEEDAKPRRWDIRDIVDIKLNENGDGLLLAGYAAVDYMGNISNPMKHHLRIWIDFVTLSTKYYIDTNRELSPFHSYRGGMVALSDKKRLVVDGYSEVIVIDMEKGTSEVVGTHTTDVSALAAASNELRIAAGGESQHISIFTPKSDGQWQREVIELGGEAGIEFLQFVDDETLAIARTDMTVTLLTLSKKLSHRDVILDGNLTWKAPRTKIFSGHEGRITDMVVSLDGRWVVTASADRTVRLWSVKEDHRRVLKGSNAVCNIVKYADHGGAVVIASEDGFIRTYQADPPHRYSRLADPSLTFWEPRISDRNLREGDDLTQTILLKDWKFTKELRWLEGGEILYVSTYNNVNGFWRGSELIYTASIDDLTLKEDSNQNFPDSPQSVFFTWAEISVDGKLTIQRTKTFSPDKKAAPGVFSADMSRFAYFDDERGSVSIYDTDRSEKPGLTIKSVYGSFVRSEYGHSLSHQFAKFSTNNRFLAFSNQYDGKRGIVILDLVSGRVTTFSENFIGDAFDISPQGLLAIGGKSGQLLFYDLFRKSFKSKHLHAERVRSVAFNQSGTFIATGSDDRTVRLWSEGGVNSYAFQLLNPVSQVTFSKDGKELIAASGPAFHVWRVPNESLRNEIKPLIQEPQDNKHNIPVDKDLTFLVQQEDPAKKNAVALTALDRKREPDPERIEVLLTSLQAKNSSGNDRFRLILELSTSVKLRSDQLQQLVTAFLQEEPGSENAALIQHILTQARADGDSALMIMLSKEKEANRQVALIDLIEQIDRKPTVSVPVIRSLLKSQNKDVQLAAALAISKSESTDYIYKILGDALYTAHARSKQISTRLAEIGVPAIPVLISALNSPERVHFGDDPSKLASKALVVIGDSALQILIEQMRNQTGEAKIHILQALQGFGEKADLIVPDLISILEISPQSKANQDLELEALRTLYAIGPSARAAMPQLIAIMLNSSRSQWDASLVARKLGNEVIPQLMQALDKADENVSYLVDTIAEFGPNAAIAVNALVGHLRRSSDGESNIYEALGKIGPAAQAAVPILIEKLDKTDGFNRMGILETLGAIKSRPELVVPVITRILQQEIKNLPEGYRITHDALLKMEKAGIPENVLLKLRFMDRPDGFLESIMNKHQYISANILQQHLSSDEFNLYGKQILELSKVKDSLKGDTFGTWRSGCEALQAFGADAKTAAPTLLELRERLANYVDIVAYIDAAMAKIKANN